MENHTICDGKMSVTIVSHFYTRLHIMHSDNY